MAKLSQIPSWTETMSSQTARWNNQMDKPAERAEAVRYAKSRQAEAPDTPVVISADKSVKYELVLSVMDELQKADIRRVGLSVKPAGK